MQGFDLCDEWDVVCGTVVAANALYEGEWTRNFEGEEDQSQNGAAYNPLMSGAYNLKTGLVAASSKASEIISTSAKWY